MVKLSKFERTRILSARALQISDSAPVYLDKSKQTSTIKLAEDEYNAGKTPLKVIKDN